MLVERRSILSRKINSMDLPVTEEQLKEFAGPKHSRRLVQHIFPDLNDTQREFLITGMSEEEQSIFFEMEEEYGE